MTQTAFEYVTDTLKITAEEGETQRDYLERVAYEIQGMDETAWDQLPVPCQEWYNSAADIIASASESGEEKPTYELPEIPGMSKPVVKEKKTSKAKAKTKTVTEDSTTAEVEANAETEEGTEEGTEETVKRGRGRPKGSPSVPKAEKPEKEPKGPIAAASVREVLCNNMDLSLDETMAELERLGVVMQRSSCQVVHLNTIRAFEMAIQMKEVKNKAGVVVLTAAE